MKKLNLLTFRISLQLLLLFFAVYLVAQGLWGDPFAPKNMATLMVWVHYRGLLVLSLLLWGNLFCMGCPFILIRDGLRLFKSPKLSWPSPLKNKRLGLFLFALMLFLYEDLSLWSSPKFTAILILAFFISIIIVDLTFTKASFCKYLCPIGTFNFFSSTLSPKTINAKNADFCTACKTKDCLLGNKEKNLRGCELDLLIPKKKGNRDCTFCLDCMSACPSQNVQIASVVPASEIADIPQANSAGIILFLFGALVNAFSMIGPGHELREKIKAVLPFSSDTLSLLIIFFLFLVLLPALLLFIPEWISRKSGNKKNHLIQTLLPLAFSIWLAHYSFHFFTGLFTFVPLISHFSIPTQWMGLRAAVVTPIQMGILFLGFCGSVATCLIRENKMLVKGVWTGAYLIILLLAIWLFSMPMEMRGTFIGVSP